jgi:GNAT superfamily N-acetyltransferase
MNDLHTLGKAMRAALKDACHNGLIYWEPNTERGHREKALMMARIEDTIAAFDKALAEKPAAPPAPADVASALRRLGDECWSLVCKDYPIADTGDADVGYEVVSHHQAKPTERREGFGRTPIEALQDAGLLIAAPPAPADESGWDNFGRAPAPSPKPQAYERPPAPADVAGPLDAARKQLLAMSVGGCTCGIKSPDVHFHDARCRYRQAQECLENVEAAAAPPAPADVAGLVTELAENYSLDYKDTYPGEVFRVYENERHRAAAALTAQAGEIDKLTRERNEHCAARNMLVADDEWRGVELAAAKARIAELKRALRIGADGHTNSCDAHYGHDCSCGWPDRLTRAALAKGGEP